jgi:hypothetical protein
MTLREYVTPFLDDMVGLSQRLFVEHPLGQNKHSHVAISSGNEGSAGGKQ